MTSRKTFLTHLFHLLDENSVRYCILRNYDNIFEDESSDVDIIVDPADLLLFKETIRTAATRARHQLIHRARYSNYSYVFRNMDHGFLRVDFETEARWRLFPILSARSMVEQRQRRGSFFIPDPVHESVILFIAAIWRSALSERYRQQLARLYEACPDKEKLRRTYRDSFGAAGDVLYELHGEILIRELSPALFAKIKRSIFLNCTLQPGKLATTVGNTFEEIGRFWERLIHPAGLSLLFVSRAGRNDGFSELIRRMEFLFPEQKCFVQTCDLTGSSRPGLKRIVQQALQRLRTLFKGGLFIQHYVVEKDSDLTRVVKRHSRVMHPSRTFICMQDSQQRSYLAHLGTGFMADSANFNAGEAADPDGFLIQFITAILGKGLSKESTAGGKGKFAILIGLDGSGKTTLARNISWMAAAGQSFAGVRYFHWRPKAGNKIEFPFPEFRETARKQPLSRNFANSFLSCLRLTKNAILANFAYYFRLRPLLRRNYLILIDRYFYNYHLDPVSVKYYGPAWFLAFITRLFPKPDLAITLNAGAETLLQRKQELTAEQISEQVVLKNKLDFGKTPTVAIDAKQAPQAMLQATLTALSNTTAMIAMTCF